ncbi:(2Fe-2S)-binding protein [Deinococcus sp.]|uniref:(2Fe-2S)-binding protein n=1 Tax=Deinococcus sp. TaxID=47478 RepID=UPI003B59652A
MPKTSQPAAPIADAPTTAAPGNVPLKLRINGQDQHLSVPPWTTLLDLLREELHLTGTKKGCDHGQCGACTVLIGGVRINSCLTLAVARDGADVTTIEGLAEGDTLHPLQQAFLEHDAFQCGYCTPGQICSAHGLLSEGQAHSRAEVRELMSGNLCRCGAYTNITDAVLDVMAQDVTTQDTTTQAAP